MLNQKIIKMEFSDLKINRTYRAKKPKFDGLFNPLVKDRQIIHISYSKHPVRKGKKYIHTKEYKEWFEINKEPFDAISSELIQEKYENITNQPCIEYDYVIQYDTPGGFGKHYPKAYAKDFLKWAAEDVSDKLPKGEWAKSL